MRFPRLVARAVLLAAVAAPALPGLATTTVTTGSAVRTVATVEGVRQHAVRSLDVPLRAHDRLVGGTWTAGATAVSVRWRGASGRGRRAGVGYLHPKPATG